MYAIYMYAQKPRGLFIGKQQMYWKWYTTNEAVKTQELYVTLIVIHQMSFLSVSLEKTARAIITKFSVFTNVAPDFLKISTQGHSI